MGWLILGVAVVAIVYAAAYERGLDRRDKEFARRHRARVDAPRFDRTRRTDPSPTPRVLARSQKWTGNTKPEE